MRANCENCGKTFIVPDSMAGKAGRCPSCGMTTSWAYFVRGQWLQSLRVNSGGFLLACFSLILAVLAIQTCWTARPPSVATQQWVTTISVSILAVTLLDWAFRLAS